MDYGKKKKMKDGGMAKKYSSGALIRAGAAGAKGAKKIVSSLKDKFGKPTNKIKGMDKNKPAKRVKKMMGGGMAMKYKHGGKVGKKCPRDGIAMKGKTRA